MSVKPSFEHLFKNRVAASTAVGLIVLVVFLVATSFTKRTDRDLLSKKANLIVREIGHQLLLQSGDSTSRVQPVTEISPGTFRLPFENEFIFNHDTLMRLSQSLLDKAQFPAGYTVTIHECVKNEIVYGFQVNHSSLSILPCQGRSEPPGCYAIEVAFADLQEKPVDYPLMTMIGSALLLLLGIAVMVGYRGKSKPSVSIEQNIPAWAKEHSQMLPLGKFLFDVKAQRLVFGTEVISLTEKECKILELLNANFGELMTRDTLMEKIWINEGVITSRSLDMFVSKLRKKLNIDADLRITNVHGKGYKLEVFNSHSHI